MSRCIHTPSLALLTLALSVGSLLGCGGDGPAPLGPDARPALGAQIDRARRPAVSTALIATFASFEERNDVRDRYNQAGPATWSSFAPEMTFGLGVLTVIPVAAYVLALQAAFADGGSIVMTEGLWLEIW